MRNTFSDFAIEYKLVHLISDIICRLFPDHLTRDCSMPKGVSIIQIPSLLEKFLSILELHFSERLLFFIFNYTHSLDLL